MLLDKLLVELDHALKTFSLSGKAINNPADTVVNKGLTADEKILSISLMRVNHVGEVCAQALYYGQSLVTKDLQVKQFLENSAQEELDHLSWCQARIEALGGRVSYLNIVWYSFSFLFGVMAGLSGNSYGLGFVMATEQQVEQHLQSHLAKLPLNDAKSKAVVKQMILDEAKHADTAAKLGGKQLPQGLQNIMRLVAKTMTVIAVKV